MDVHYLDFELEIGAGDRVVYPLSVIHSPAGALARPPAVRPQPD